MRMHELVFASTCKHVAMFFLHIFIFETGNTHGHSRCFPFTHVKLLLLCRAIRTIQHLHWNKHPTHTPLVLSVYRRFQSVFRAVSLSLFFGAQSSFCYFRVSRQTALLLQIHVLLLFPFRLFSSFIFCFVVVLVIVAAVVFDFLLLNWNRAKKTHLDLSRINSCPKWVWTNILNRPIIWEMPMSNFIKSGAWTLSATHSQLLRNGSTEFLDCCWEKLLLVFSLHCLVVS